MRTKYLSSASSTLFTALGVLALTSSLAACAKKPKDDTAATASSASAKPSASAMNQMPKAPQVPPPEDVAAAPADAQKTASGLATKVITPGTGTTHPGPSDRVKVNYTGWTTDGTTFDSSVTRGQPAMFGVGQVIPGWTEGLQLMVTGEKRRLWIPANLAYGPRAMPNIPANSALTFDVELLDIVQAPPAPPDVAAAPANATKTASGLAYRVLTPSTNASGAKPSATSMVSVNYTGWTTDGKMFDSTVMRGQPAHFPLSGVIKGWTEGLQLMKVGDKFRFWIPGSLAYDDPTRPPRPGAPKGTLVFDVELLDVSAAPAMPAGMNPHMMRPPGAGSAVPPPNSQPPK